MADITALAAFLTSIKTAANIAKAIKEAGISLEKAEVKFKMAELIEALADAKIHAAEIQEVLQEKDRVISELGKAFELKSKLTRSGDAYYEIDEHGNPIGDPFCSHCWEVHHKAVHVNYDFQKFSKSCPACKTRYDSECVQSLPRS